MNETNPLLSESFRIPFDRVRPEHVRSGVDEILRAGQERLEALAGQAEPPTWENTMEPLDSVTRWVSERVKPVTHLITVQETRELRDAFNVVLPAISAFWTRLPLNTSLWRRIEGLSREADSLPLTSIQKRHLDKTVTEFRRAGADLAGRDKERLEEIKVELAQVEQEFSEHVLDETAAWELHVTDADRLRGVPDSHLARFRAAAAGKNKKGCLLTLDHPSVEPIVKYAHERELRREVYEAYVTRCRDGEFDNRALIVRVLELRQQLAELMGYEDYADFRLEDHMVKSGARASAFEGDMRDLTHAYWAHDVAELRAHARELGLDELLPWDVAYVQESLRRKDYDIDDEMLRPYFPLETVMDGLFDIARRVFRLTVKPAPCAEVWHEDVRFYEIHDDDGTFLGGFYTDWYPRKEKRQGAWMADLRSGGPLPDGSFEPHLGVICGNFAPPQGDEPSLLTHREVETVFHEFGHLLHHSTSRVPVRARGGLNVAWDWVELPSQLMENWTWEREAFDMFARHYRTGDMLPDHLFDRMVAARRFMGGWRQMRQLSFGTVDLALHREYARRTDRGAASVMEFGRECFVKFSPTDAFADLHILTSFTHLFSGGYAAGYYSYLWSEVLDADVFTRFREEGIFNSDTGREYVRSILSRGDSDDPERLFREFMGRDPDPAALLERNLGPVPRPAAA
ncbi:MAG: M3 family metallopeptidase [Gemmatimonadota bacterium]|nr:M3 family metallopeptidase [Gemmatimonadota bacterium]